LASTLFSKDPFPSGARVACRIEYDGNAYNGWQSQPVGHNSTTVQDVLETALAQIAQQPIRVHCAGRTDSGVHGHCQIIHFDQPVERSARAWTIGVNTSLPTDVRVHWAQVVQASFHARFSATARRYRYLIANTAIRPALLHRYAAWHRRPLDAAAMHHAAQCLVGNQDFSAFRAASCQSSSPVRDVHHVAVTRHADLVVIDIQANAFLHHMVRNLAGSLMAIGDGRRDAAWLVQLLAARDRTLAADTAPACGLYLVDVLYPSAYELPPTPAGPALLHGLSSL
jgi:tRNA pseudouridine38-40 synthase